VAAAGWLGKMYLKRQRAVMGEAHSLREVSMTRVVVSGTDPPVCELTTADIEATMPVGGE
jgi:hypothetical protein